MHDKISYNESKVLRLLMEDSRMSILDISKKLALNRNTVSGIIKKLNSNIIDRYTVETKEPENSLYIIIETEDINSVDQDKVIEYFELANGNYIVIMNRDALIGSINYTSINMAYRRVINKIPSRIELYCDYCRGTIAGKPQTYETADGTLYFCCNTCKSDYIDRLGAVKSIKK
jgi:DNA-binding Lrp family transcriptional regulator